MNNYEYIIASLPVTAPDAPVPDAEVLVSAIRNMLSEKDSALAGQLLALFDPDSLTPEYYVGASKTPNAFIRAYTEFDLKLRNAKVDFLNRTLERPEGRDVMPLPPGMDEEFDRRAEADAVLARTDIIEREKGLDSLMWDKADELVQMHVLDLDIILSFIAKIKIADRWNKLDPATGRDLFRKLVQEIRNTR